MNSISRNRISAIKYGPTFLFIVASGVGSDKWDEQLVCRRQS